MRVLIRKRGRYRFRVMARCHSCQGRNGNSKCYRQEESIDHPVLAASGQRPHAEAYDGCLQLVAERQQPASRSARWFQVRLLDHLLHRSHIAQQQRNSRPSEHSGQRHPCQSRE